MPSQFTQLLLDTLKEVKGIQTSQENQEATLEQLRQGYNELLQRVVTLEADGKWSGKERRKVDERLGSGDHTFEVMRSEIGNAAQEASAAYEMAKQAIAAAEAARDANKDRPTGFRKRIKHSIKEMLPTLAIGILWWAVYHLLLIGPEIAKLMKAVKDGGH